MSFNILRSFVVFIMDQLFPVWLCLLCLLFSLLTHHYESRRWKEKIGFHFIRFPSIPPIFSQSIPNYPAIRSQCTPRVEIESSYQSFLPRLQNLLDRYAHQVVLCYQQGNSSCLTFERDEGIFASTPYSEDNLNPTFPQYYPVEIQSTSCQSHPRVIIGIPTSPSQYAERLAIRSTWCNSTNTKLSQLKCIFFAAYDAVETHHNDYLKEEAAHYGDIVQFRFQNSYLNLTQLQFSSYNWTVHHCPSIQFYIRSDSDMFVNPKFIQNYLIPYPRTNFAYGVYIYRGRPIRYRASKYYLPKWLYPLDFFYPYHSGCFYIWSKDILQLIVNAFHIVRPIHYIDDVYYGQIFHEYNISLKKAYNTIFWDQAPLSVDLWRKKAAAHRYSPVDLIAIYILSKPSG